MSKRITSTLTLMLAALLSVAAVASAGTPAAVTVRVEGQTSTLLGLTAVTTTTTATPAPGNCSGTTAAGALQLATSGNWDHNSYIQTILGETHAWSMADPRYWAFWINDSYSNDGLCTHELSTGDRVLMLVDSASAPSYTPTVFPLELSGVPAQVTQSVPVTVTVNKYSTAGVASAASGVTVTGASSTATTNASGQASLTFNTLGTFNVKGKKSGFAPTASVPVCVHVAGGSC
ncbi:MAG TPA: DUF4430 domain-containing protein [Solirubrobacteraceae bacterium]|nr:DUF4430 domain-containing protein [Solirubrobacteraceae bacterium]